MSGAYAACIRSPAFFFDSNERGRSALAFSNDRARSDGSFANAREALSALPDAIGFWEDFGLEPDDRPRILMGKACRARSERRSRALSALAYFDLRPDDPRAAQPRAYALASSASIDGRIAYPAESPCARPPRTEAEMRLELAAVLDDPEMPERYLGISVEDDRKRKGRVPWMSFDAMKREMLATACSFESCPQGDGAVSSGRFADVERRARYLRAQNCLMLAIGPCAFDPAAVVGYARDRENWIESVGASWLEGVRLPRLNQAVEDACSGSGADLARVLARFASAWEAYQDEVRRVFCLWKGWLGPRAEACMQRDLGFEMLCAYVDLHRTCEQLNPLVEAADDTLAAFSAIAGFGRRSRFAVERFCPVLDPVTPEEHRRRRAQSDAARKNAGRRRRGEGLDCAPTSYVGGGFDDEDVYRVFGTYDDFLRNPMRYPDDFYESKPPWER